MDENKLSKRGRPRKTDDIAKREFIGLKATLSQKNTWKEACNIFGVSFAVGIMIGALEEALKGKK